MIKDNWFTEKSFHNSVSQSFKIKEILHEEQSKWQKIQVLETHALGKLLLLDGKTMVSDLDEFVYHEIMAHVSSQVARKLDKVLIIGGGDGGVVREFTKYPEISQIDLVEIDERVIEVSKKFFPHCTIGLEDPRVRVLPEDGIKFVEKHENEYDVIIVDSTDPEDFALGLFTTEFYKNVHNALTPEGIMMAQTENTFLDEFNIKNIYQNLKEAFPIVQALTAPMIIYPGVYWSFAFCSKKHSGESLGDRILPTDLQWYNKEWHAGAFKLSNFDKKKIGL